MPLKPSHVSTNPYPPHSWINCISAYVEPDKDKEWHSCPKCGFRPKVWTFDNGRSTACGCWATTYDHFSVCAESIMSVHVRNNGIVEEYDTDGLRKNWNHWCETGELLFTSGNGRW